MTELLNSKIRFFCVIFQFVDSSINHSSVEKDFQSSYRTLLLRVHPDKNINNAVEQDQTNEALRILTELKKVKFKLAKIDTTDVFSKLSNLVNNDRLYEKFQFVDPTISDLV